MKVENYTGLTCDEVLVQYAAFTQQALPPLWLLHAYKSKVEVLLAGLEMYVTMAYCLTPRV